MVICNLGNDCIHALGALHLSAALVHPEALSDFESLNLNGLILEYICSCESSLQISKDCRTGVEGFRHICDALVRPSGPKHIINLELEGECIILDHLGNNRSISVLPILLFRTGVIHPTRN